MPRRWLVQQYMDWAVGLQLAYDSGRLRGRELSKLLFKMIQMKLEDDERVASDEQRARARRELMQASYEL